MSQRPWRYMVRIPGSEPFVNGTFATKERAEAKKRRIDRIWRDGTETWVENREVPS